MKFSACLATAILLIIGQAPAALEKLPGAKPRNIVFILSDDHRHDAMGFMGHPFLKTPHLDSIAKNGVHLQNAFVTTALCSPSRATILTGLYAHKHGVVDNNNPIRPGSTFFSQHLQAAGYETGFFGKWHMGGEGDDPQPGWNRWVSFRGQGVYLPGKAGLNVDGMRVPQRDYITDELTDYALDWLKSRDATKPWMIYVSHKAVHSEFVPAERHKGRYKDEKWTPPDTFADTPANYAGKPMWVKNQRNSWHGVDYPYHSDLDIGSYYKSYCETLIAVDDSVGRVLDFLREKGQLESTLVVYMGDNGFLFGEHGLIDKRNAYEESMRVPLIAQCPELFTGDRKVPEIITNLDIAPTVLEAAGLAAPAGLDGRSFLPLLRGEKIEGWRERFLYEYYWENNFPQTPTVHAIRTAKYKYIRYFGIWDTNELYDIQYDPQERKNLIDDPAHRAVARQLNTELFEELKATGGLYIPLQPDRGNSSNLRREEGAEAADFPPRFFKSKNEPDSAPAE